MPARRMRTPTAVASARAYTGSLLRWRAAWPSLYALVMRTALALLMLLTAAVAADPKKPPHGIKTIQVDYTYASFHSNEAHFKVQWSKGAFRTGKRTVDGKVIDALYVAAMIGIRESDHDLRCISHTDDYPGFTITIEGDEPLVVRSDSNCHGHVPWNIVARGKQYVQFSGDVGHAVDALFAAIDPASWKVDSPEAYTMMGGEYVELDRYTGANGTGAAAACAKDLESSPAARKVFGAAVKVTELDLACDLTSSADCSKTQASAAFAWAGLAAKVDLPCSNGALGLDAAAVASLAQVKAFVESKPVRALVKLSPSGPPRMWNNGGWEIESMEDDMPRLSWMPGAKVIEVRAVGDRGPGGTKFFRELGLDAKKLTQPPRDSFYETTATLDFTGRITRTP